MATPPDFTAGQVLTAAQMNAIGLWKIIPTGATNGTVGANGDVTIGSAVSFVTVSGVFTADYLNYKIMWTGINSPTAGEEIRLTFTNGTSSLYRSSGWNVDYIGGSGLVSFLGAAYCLVGYTGINNDAFGQYDILSPFNNTNETSLTGMGGRRNNNFMGYGMYADTASHSGFTLTANTTTMTGGTVQVYGYN
jgi:hypothetical protein